MKTAWWIKSLAALALAALTWFPAAPAQAQITMPGHMATTTQNTLKFSGIVAAVGPDVVSISANGSILRIPMSIARFEVNGLPIDSTKLYAGLPVTVSMGSVRGTIVAMTGNRLTVLTPSGVVELPSVALNSPMLSGTLVAFRDINGNVTSIPMHSAMDLQYRGMGTLAIGAPISSVGVTTIGAPTGVIVGTRPGTTTMVTTTTVAPGTTAIVAGSNTQPMIFTYPNMTLHGTVSRLQPDMLLLDVNGQLVQIPSSMNATYTLNGRPVVFSDMSAGSHVQVLMPSFTGSVRSIDNGMVTMDMGNGQLWVVPMAALPSDFTGRSMVWMRGADGRLIQVPLNAAVQYQSRGAVIVPAGSIAVPPSDIRYEIPVEYVPRVEDRRIYPGPSFEGNDNFSQPTVPADVNR